MGKNKLQRFAENIHFPHLLQPGSKQLLEGELEQKGKWNAFFANDHPIVAELGCGRGEYTVGLAEYFPKKNFIGLDIKGARLWYGAKAVADKKIGNAAFVRTRIDFIEKVFAENELDEIWITFPDPQPQKPRERKRLTSPLFLNRYAKVLKPGGVIHLKTDNIHFFDYTLEIIREHNLELIEEVRNLHAKQEVKEHKPWLQTINTYYERIFLSQEIPIHYVAFRPPAWELDTSKSRAIGEIDYRTKI